MTNIQKFFTYLGFSDTSINERQLLELICILNEEQHTLLRGISIDKLLNEVITIFIEKMETNSFKNITEQNIIERLVNV